MNHRMQALRKHLSDQILGHVERAMDMAIYDEQRRANDAEEMVRVLRDATDDLTAQVEAQAHRIAELEGQRERGVWPAAEKPEPECIPRRYVLEWKPSSGQEWRLGYASPDLLECITYARAPGWCDTTARRVRIKDTDTIAYQVPSAEKPEPKLTNGDKWRREWRRRACDEKWVLDGMGSIAWRNESDALLSCYAHGGRDKYIFRLVPPGKATGEGQPIIRIG